MDKNTVSRKTFLSTKKMILCALFAALTAVFSQIVIPLPFTPVPVNLATLAVLLSGALLGAGAGALSQLVFILVGAVGLPVFTRMQGGLAVLLGPTGGYIIGYLAAAALTGIIAEHSKQRFLSYIIAMAAGLLVCYLFGTAWYMFLTASPLSAALISCVVPFLPGDALKIAAGAFLARSVSSLI